MEVLKARIEKAKRLDGFENNENTRKAILYCIEKLIEGERDLEKIKKEASSKFNTRVIKTSEIYANFPKEKLNEEIKKLLFRKPVRTISGVSPIAVMIKPQQSCKWGCIYCPFTGKAAKSYTGEEPSALRARRVGFDPYLQVKSRLYHYSIQGHPSDKIELIVMGGTFLAMEKSYRRYFIKNLYDALNDKKSRNIAHAKKINERAKHRVVGLTLETRPDVCGREEINEALYYGATRMELGVQNPDDEIYEATKRGHSVKDVINATTLLKDSAFKICYHLMPGLPLSNPKKDVEMFKKIFEDPSFKPDMLKIYPTLVVKPSILYTMYERGEYTPYDVEEAAEVIAKAYSYIPEYVRVMRVQRDIPTKMISDGVQKSNLRQIVERKIEEMGIEIKEIRYREAGIRKKEFSWSKVRINRIDYEASGSKEIFLSCEDAEKTIYGFIRLRIAGKNAFRKEIREGTALIRELHVYGSEAPLKERGRVQHRGIGSKLLREAEELAKHEFGSEEMIIIAGVGVREFYYKHGYKPKGPYVYKKL